MDSLFFEETNKNYAKRNVFKILSLFFFAEYVISYFLH